MAKLEYTFKTDTLFKMLFVQRQDLLKSLVSELLGIQAGSIGQFVITNPEMPPDALGDKFCRLDINMTGNGWIWKYRSAMKGTTPSGCFTIGRGNIQRRLP
jgi:hypothetical protein